MQRKSLGAIASLLSLVSVSFTAEAQQGMTACVRKSTGRIMVRSRCLRGEAPLTVQAISSAPPVQAASVQAIQGPRGDTGPQGPVGPQGLKGEVGPQGATGLQGPKGDQGLKGDTGAQGVRGETGPQGLRGDAGATGPQGPQGAQGARGQSAFEPLPGGTTINGVIGGEFYASAPNTGWSITESLHALSPTVLGNEVITVANNSLVDNDCDGQTCLTNEDSTYARYCSGSAEAPSAPPGWLCVYPSSVTNATSVRAYAVPSGSTRWGFVLRWVSRNSGSTMVRAVWAYTAP